MITYQITPGTADVSVVIRIIDSTDGTPETGVVFNTAGIDLQYRREGAVSTAITEATLAALTTAHTDGGFLEIGNGYYRLDLPDAACATGAAGCLVHGTVTGMVVIGCYIQLEAAVNKVYSDTTIIYSDTTIATSKAVQIYSDTSIIYSDTSIIYSDTTIATSKTTQIYSDTTIIASKAVQIYSDTTAAASGTSPDVLVDTTITVTNQTTFVLAAGSADNDAYNGMAAILTDQSTAAQKWLSFVSDYVGASKTITLEDAPGFTIATGDSVAIMAAGGSTSVPVPAALSTAQASQVTKAASKVTQIYSDTAIIYSDTTIATSKTTQIYSDTTITSSKAVQVYSDTTAIHTQATTAASKAVQIYSDTAAAATSLAAVYSDTTIIYSDTTIATSKATQIYSDTAIASSKAVQVYSDTTIVASKAVQVYSDTTALVTGVNVTSVIGDPIVAASAKDTSWGGTV